MNKYSGTVPSEHSIGGNIAVECSQTVLETISLDYRLSSLLVRSLTIVMSSLPLHKAITFSTRGYCEEGRDLLEKGTKKENSLSERRERTAPDPFQWTNQQQFERFYEPIPHTNDFEEERRTRTSDTVWRVGVVARKLRLRKIWI